MNANAIAVAVTLIEDIRKNVYPLQFVSVEKLERVLECVNNQFGMGEVRGQIVYDYRDGMDLHVKMTLWCLKNQDVVMNYNFNPNMSYAEIANRLIENEIIRRIG